MAMNLVEHLPALPQCFFPKHPWAPADLADVVQHAAKTDVSGFFRAQSDFAGQAHGVQGNAPGMALGVAVFRSKGFVDGIEFDIFSGSQGNRSNSMNICRVEFRIRTAGNLRYEEAK
jgi:hypothetical protein